MYFNELIQLINTVVKHSLTYPVNKFVEFGDTVNKWNSEPLDFFLFGCFYVDYYSCSIF